jgi:glycosyltransferase involved in cell wall biosynthesis
MKKLKIAALILTYNEEINITACIKSLHFVDQVFVFDSFSNDNSVSLAKEEGAEVFQRKFDNYASQRNEALKAVPELFDWVLMIDADERITAELEVEILDVLRNVESKNTMYCVRRKDMLNGKWLKHSSGYPTWFPRFFKNNSVTVEREINEEYITTGEISNLQNHLLHYPFNKGIEWWFQRHNVYSSMEAVKLNIEIKEHYSAKGIMSKDPMKRRKAQKQLLYRIPCRPQIMFFALFILRLGFLDGKQGYLYCKLRKTYEWMIDLKVKELNNTNL